MTSNACTALRLLIVPSQTREVRLSVKAVTEMDMAYAREDFAEKLNAIQPIVGNEGKVECKRPLAIIPFAWLSLREGALMA